MGEISWFWHYRVRNCVISIEQCSKLLSKKSNRRHMKCQNHWISQTVYRNNWCKNGWCSWESFHVKKCWLRVSRQFGLFDKVRNTFESFYRICYMKIHNVGASWIFWEVTGPILPPILSVYWFLFRSMKFGKALDDIGYMM